MTRLCRTCKADLSPAQTDWPQHNITQGICRPCLLKLDGSRDTGILDSIDAPVLLMQETPRQVLTANKKALELFKKTFGEIEGHRGGQVFDCIHSFTEAGCGKDTNCEGCKIKNAIVDTFTTGARSMRYQLTLKSRKPMIQLSMRYKSQPKKWAIWPW